MANCAKSEASLSEVKNADGNAFSSKADRDEFIVQYYEKLYTKPLIEPDDLSGCIDSFLGPEILAHPLVKNSILTKDEQLKLESPLTLLNLTKPLKMLTKNPRRESMV